MRPLPASRKSSTRRLATAGCSSCNPWLASGTISSDASGNARYMASACLPMRSNVGAVTAANSLSAMLGSVRHSCHRPRPDVQDHLRTRQRAAPAAWADARPTASRNVIVSCAIAS